MKKLLLLVFAGAGIMFFSISVHAQTAGVTIPSVPQNFVATTTGISEVTLTWDASVESSGEIAGYTVYRNSREVATTTGNSYVDSGLAPGLYTYSVGAYDINGILSPGETASQAVLIYSTVPPPSAPTGLAATGTLYTNSYSVPASVTISWNPSAGVFGVAGYVVQRNGTPVNSTSSLYTANAMTDSLLPGNYSYTVTAYDEAFDASPISATLDITVGLYMTPPSVPAGISVAQTAPDGITLSWARSTDGVGVAGYDIYQDGTQIATVSSSPYVESGLATGTPYVYQMDAYDNAGNISALSSGSPAITLQDDYAPSVSVPVPVPTPTLATAPNATSVPLTALSTLFTQSLYDGLRSDQVQALQSVLAAQGYLSPQYETGFFGSLTLAAVQQFQCTEDIVCTGGAGWGLVGPKTRNVLNSLEGNTTSTVSAGASTPDLAAEIQALEAQVAALEKQL
ncbi:MAG TPA: peptidoglycan-binding protein [Candidatus Paceibacterota bacterium]|nr:peptidoglycan-binding protein [Candidatus Paceibacterota bacterium]